MKKTAKNDWEKGLFFSKKNSSFARKIPSLPFLFMCCCFMAVLPVFFVDRQNGTFYLVVWRHFQNFGTFWFQIGGIRY